MWSAILAIGLIMFVVVFNLTLFMVITWLVHKYNNQSVFPALVLFLSFALSIGVILIVGLGEKVSTTGVEQDWIKRIGVTNIMVIVAVLLGLVVTFSSVGKSIIMTPDQNDKLHFMLAKIAVTCTTAKVNLPEATDLLVMISSNEEDDIRQVKAFLGNAKDMKVWLRSKEDLPGVKILTQKSDDETYQLMERYGKQYDRSLTEDLKQDAKWVAYKIPVGKPDKATLLPVPTIYERNLRTRLFVITNQASKTPNPELNQLNPEPAGANRNLTPLFQAGIVPRKPKEESYLTDLEFSVFADHICWRHDGA
jgi:hypothetical protein